MAKTIKETPILTGADAVRFYKNMKDAETKKVSTEELLRVKKGAERLKAIWTG